MDFSQRTTTIAGLAMIVAAVLTIVIVALTIFAGESEDVDPFDEDEAAEFLETVNDDEDTIIAGAAVGILNDAVFIPLVAVAFFILFRDRSPFLATAAMIGLAVAAAISLFVDGSNILLTIIASDFVEGGPEGVEPGEPGTLQLGRYIGMTTLIFFNVAISSAGLGLLAIGLLLVGAPEGIVNPPRWMGWVAIISGAAAGLAWLVVAAEPFFVFFPIQGLSMLVFLIGLGVWLLRRPDLQPAPMRA